MSTPEEAKSEVETAFDAWAKQNKHTMDIMGDFDKYVIKKAFYAGVKFVTDLNQEKIAQLIKEESKG